MLMMKKLLIGGAGLAALATAAPSAAQYYGYSQPAYGYGYAQPAYGYGNNYAYGAMNTSVATSQCTAAVQNRLYTRNGLGGILGSLIGSYGSPGRVVSITRVTPNYGYTRVRGLASSGRYGGYGYAGQGQVDLTWKCKTDYRGFIADIDIDRVQRNYGYGNYTPYNGYDYSQYGYRRY